MHLIDLKRDRDSAAVKVSIIIPVFNEEENVGPLAQKIYAVVKALPDKNEIIFIDDGSTDQTLQRLVMIAQELPIRIVPLRRNFGQTAALMAGLDYALGEIIIPMDGDGQNDPTDIPRLLEKIEEGYDVVSGWRKDRQDSPIKRNLVSRIANTIISKMSGVHLNDYGCSLKAYRRETIDGLRLYGEMHRLIPIYVAQRGGRITEIPVKHHAREFGVSKYGLERIFKVILDLFVSQFFARFHTKPVYLFGGIALVCFFLAGLAGFYAVVLKVFFATSFIQTPLPLLMVFTFLCGLICFLMGIQSEQLMRIYHESQNLKPYLVRKTLPHIDDDSTKSDQV
jgi:glycosyltransferase involved in cell wall biosynthesis